MVSSGNAQVHTNIVPILTVIHSPNTDNILSHNVTPSLTHASSTTPSLLSSAPSTNFPFGPSESSTTTTPDPSFIPVVSHPTNTHLMVTRAKVSTHKPKVYHALVPSLPLIPIYLKEAISVRIYGFKLGGGGVNCLKRVFANF